MVQLKFTSFVYSQLTQNFELPNKDLTGQVVIVTGSNVGLGLESARHLAAMNPSKLILACRDTVKAEAAITDIKNTTNSVATIQAWKLDLQSFDSVKLFVEKCNRELDRLDILVENAGIATAEYRLTADKWESTIQTNVLSTFLLAILLLPLLRKTTKKNSDTRLVIVASEVHHWSPFDERDAPNIFERLNDQTHFKPNDRYQISKLLDVLLTRALAENMKAPEDKSISVTSVNPGLCHSELGREAGWGLWLMKKALARTTEMGARTLTHSAVGKLEPHATKGTYYSDCKETEPSDFVIGEEGKKAQDRLWTEMVQILSRVDSSVKRILQQ
ncbi:retinol dehydrogenase [Acrasis kona]|uniref:Retinol dehydrogenase n=1 Tax=Acrasis kona TaxID=1008807 RepID=A0AAW2ZB05_9EUKA